MSEEIKNELNYYPITDVVNSFSNTPTNTPTLVEDTTNVAPSSNGTILTDGTLQSPNFVTGATGSGWKLDATGSIEANNGNFRGDITGASGTFSGSITASTGSIGGFNIGADYVRDVANSFGLASTVTAGNDVRFWSGDTFANKGSAPIRIYENGDIVATNITATGAIFATSGWIGSATALVYESQGINTGTTGHVRGGQTDYNTGTGYFLGYASGLYKLSIGDATTSNSLLWDGATLTVNGSPVTINGFFGDGSDGAVTYSVDTTLAAPVYATSISVASGKILNTAGYPIFCRGTLTNAGTITNAGKVGTAGSNGANASGGTNGNGGAGGAEGTAVAAGTLAGGLAGVAGSAGGNGDLVGTAGNNGSNIANSGASDGSAGRTGGTGGNGDQVGVGAPPATIGSAGGSGGTAGIRSSTLFARNFLEYQEMRKLDFSAGTWTQINGGAGGGSGGGGGGGGIGPNQNSAGGGGGGGGGSASCGGTILIFSHIIVNSGTISTAGGIGGKGGNGGNGSSAGGNGGGGGGGGGGGAGGDGGAMVLVYSSLTNTGTITSLGGTGGVGGTGGTPGNGSATAGATPATASSGANYVRRDFII